MLTPLTRRGFLAENAMGIGAVIISGSIDISIGAILGLAAFAAAKANVTDLPTPLMYALPVIAGIMPVTGLSQVKRFTKLCGSKIPAELLDRLEATGGDPEQVGAIGVEHATRQCRDLLDNGVPGIHFCTLNRSPATKQILTALR